MTAPHFQSVRLWESGYVLCGTRLEQLSKWRLVYDDGTTLCNRSKQIKTRLYMKFVPQFLFSPGFCYLFFVKLLRSSHA